MGPASSPAGGDRSPAAGDGSLSDVVVVSNRGPLSFRLEDGIPVPAASGGGLAGSLRPLVEGTGATWVASSLTEADRKAAAQGLMEADGLRIELVEPDSQVYNLAYNVVSNATLWFCHHHLFDSARRPRTDRRWLEAWEAYREFNRLTAERVAAVAPEGGRVLVQDYHLALIGSPPLRPPSRSPYGALHPHPLRRPGGPADAPDRRRRRAAGRHGPLRRMRLPLTAVGLGLPCRPGRRRSRRQRHVRRAPVERRGPARARRPPTRRWPRQLARIEESVGGVDRQVIVRVDRMELSKNLLRGFWAFEELLEQEPRHRERVVFVALAYPTRQGLPEYLSYQDEVRTTVERVNERWATPGWTPIVLEVEDDYPRSLAALTRSDVLLVNPVRDGLNLVAMEGPILNDRDGVLALSREAGAFDQLAAGALEVNPFDVTGTATVLARALAMDPGERAARAGVLRAAIGARRPADWLAEQRAAAR